MARAISGLLSRPAQSKVRPWGQMTGSSSERCNQIEMALKRWQQLEQVSFGATNVEGLGHKRIRRARNVAEVAYFLRGRVILRQLGTVSLQRRSHRGFFLRYQLTRRGVKFLPGCIWS